MVQTLQIPEWLIIAKTNAMPQTDAPVYAIPMRYRVMENLHIVFWLFKDLAWCMGWKAFAVIMVMPTLAIAIMIAYRTRHIVSELCHNLAVAVWISANSYWMFSEFLGIDSKPIGGGYTYKHLAVIPFAIGILVLAYYYLWYKRRHKSSAEVG